MARDFAAINLAIHQDPDWRRLPMPAKHLYWTLWTHPQLSRAGVTDWRPGRIAALIDDDWTADDVQLAADCLEARLFIVTDDRTEEVLVRSWVRFDGLMKSPIMSVTFANDYAAVASPTVQGVIVHELQRLHERDPDLAAWTKQKVRDVLAMPSVDPRDRDLPTDPLTPDVTRALTPSATLGLTHSPTPDPTRRVEEANPQADPSANPSPTPSPSPSPYLHALPGTDVPDDATPKSSRRKPERPLPETWKPNARHHELAIEKRVDITHQVTRFRNHAQTHDRRARDWDAAFRTWLDKSDPDPKQNARRDVGVDQWLA